MPIFSKGPLWRITVERWIRAGVPAIGCVEAPRTRGCMALPVSAPPPSSSHPRFPMHVHATHTGMLCWDPRFLNASDEGIVCGVGLVAPLVQRGQVLLGQFAYQSEKSRTTVRPDVIVAVPPMIRKRPFCHVWGSMQVPPKCSPVTSTIAIFEWAPQNLTQNKLEELIGGATLAQVAVSLLGFFAARAHRKAARRPG